MGSAWKSIYHHLLKKKKRKHKLGGKYLKDFISSRDGRVQSTETRLNETHKTTTLHIYMYYEMIEKKKDKKTNPTCGAHKCTADIG